MVSWRKGFTGWRAERVMTEHQFIFLYRGKGEIIINQETIDFYLVQFTYLLVENQRPGWHFKSDKNFSIMESWNGKKSVNVR